MEYVLYETMTVKLYAARKAWDVFHPFECWPIREEVERVTEYERDELLQKWKLDKLLQ